MLYPVTDQDLHVYLSFVLLLAGNTKLRKTGSVPLPQEGVASVHCFPGILISTSLMGLTLYLAHKTTLESGLDSTALH